MNNHKPWNRRTWESHMLKTLLHFCRKIMKGEKCCPKVCFIPVGVKESYFKYWEVLDILKLYSISCLVVRWKLREVLHLLLLFVNCNNKNIHFDIITLNHPLLSYPLLKCFLFQITCLLLASIFILAFCIW